MTHYFKVILVEEEKEKGFIYLDHPADLEILAFGKTLEELFKNAARAMFNAISPNYEEVTECQEEFTVEVSAENIEDLLFKWMSELVFLFDINFVLPKTIDLKIEKVDNKFLLRGKLCGEKFNPNKHDYAVGIKAMTYNMLRIEEFQGGFKAHFVMDI